MISIIIPSRNNLKDLKRSIRGLVPDKEGQEVIVVDDHSVDGTVEWLKQNTWIKSLESEGSRGVLMNAGAKAACGSVLLFLTPGVRLERGWVAKVEQAAQSDFSFGAFQLGFDLSPIHQELADADLLDKVEVLGKLCFYQLPIWGSRLRSFFWKLPLLNQGLVVDARYFEASHGFMDMPLAEDLEWVRRATKTGARPKSLSGACINRITPYVRDGEWIRLCRNFKTVTAFLQGKGVKELTEAYEGEHNAVLVWYRAAEAGSLPERLKPFIEGEDLRATANSLVQHILRVAEKSWGSPKTVLSAVPEAGDCNLKEIFGSEVLVEYQRGNGLGEQVMLAMRKQFDSEIGKVLLVDPICPTLSKELIYEAFFSLDEVDVVLGPTDDGECYLVGCRPGFEEILSRVDWSSESTFQAIASAVRSNGARSKTLPRLRDIDNEEDYREFYNMGFIQY